MTIHWSEVCKACRNGSRVGTHHSIVFVNVAINNRCIYTGMGEPSNNILGLLVCSIFIGSFASAFVAPSICDRFGRRVAIFLGSCLCIVGLILQSVSNGRALFIVGRIVAGFGIGLTTCGGSMLIIELSHPSHRGTIPSMVRTAGRTED